MSFLLMLIILFSFLSPHFLSFSNFNNVVTAVAVTGLLALGVTFVIASGGIDLSVASVMALAGTFCAYVVQDSTMTAWSAMCLCILTGSLCGLITGVLINLTCAPSFIVTLGMLSVARAGAYIIASGTPIYGLPVQIAGAGQGSFLSVSIPAILLLGMSVIAHVVLHRTRFGLHTLMYGDNPYAAEVMGVRVGQLRLKIYALCGAFAGIAGFVFMARTNAGDPTGGQNYELIAITAVILGGAKLFGGQASILGTLMGVLCLGVLQNGLNLMAVSTFYQVLFVGLVLIAAAFLERMGATDT
jgi:ribose/xylose/arabinose/galactoside ABC-type transport system permease subunit